jgi:bifunctional non-homologous end joining protein LigD
VALAEYKHKRDFTRTPEPRPRVSKSRRKLIFVVQKHHASRLHYDFRLEAEGVLKSWAIPRKPSLDPSTKRLAVHVEDHPVEYAAFSGEIPEGEYGAGKVEIWDKGTYENLLADKPRPETVTEAIKHGHVEVRLKGRKLKGSFALVRMNRSGKKDNWLLIKMRDATSKRARGNAHSRNRSRSRTSSARLRIKDKLPESIKITNEDKIMFPEVEITKGDVLRYYARIADRILPHLRDRPITLERFPDGLVENAPHFWQKDTPSYYPSWIPRVKIASGDGEQVNYALVNDVQTLLYLVNQGTITFHPWFSRVEDLDRPDFVLFDLDRSKARFSDVMTVAKELHRLLKRERVKSYLKTTGKSGLHVLVPCQRRGSYDEAREWAIQIARQVVDDLPDTATVERSKAKRGERVYVDVMQNVRGRHAVPPYALRPVPQAAVSTPLRWNELTAKLNPEKFNLKTIFRRLAQQKNDPIAPLARSYHSR